jgi:hypothetical protein
VVDAVGWAKSSALTYPQPKSDLSDFGHFKVPNSGKPEFGWHGARTILPTRKTLCDANTNGRAELGGLSNVVSARATGTASHRALHGPTSGRDEMEDAMAQVITRCRLTGHYMFMGMDADPKEFIGRSGPFARKFCPFCACEHSWQREDTKFLAAKPTTGRPDIQQAS